jgi:hypothetical protein
MGYKMIITVANASLADLDRWLASHAVGHLSTAPGYFDSTVTVYLNDERDRIALRESFDVEKVAFRD